MSGGDRPGPLDSVVWINGWLMHPRSTRWALDRIEHCCAALAASTFHEQIDTDALTVTEVVDRILKRTGSL